ncbi:MAG: hypothetical protein Q4B58_06385 [Bacteroidales bacterium]|nr:hypothetical protein [Bacteroidales bacterium]
MFEFLFKKRKPLPLPYKRDLHCHIIPGVDDGFQFEEDSVSALRRMQDLGLEKVIFTPHHTAPHFLNTPEKIQPVFDHLSELMREDGLSVEAEDYSFEYRVDESFLDLMETGKWGDAGCSIRPLKGRYLLIESGWMSAIPNFELVIQRLVEQGYYLILAHPERYPYYARNYEYYYPMLQEQQVQFQCNLLSFAGHYGDHVKHVAHWMLRHGYVNFMGSDLHRLAHCERIERYLASKEYASIREALCENLDNDLI